MTYKKQNPYKIKYEFFAEQIGVISSSGCVATQDIWEEYFQAQKDYLNSLNEKVFANASKLIREIK